MSQSQNGARRQFLKSLAVGLPVAAVGLPGKPAIGGASPASAFEAPVRADARSPIPIETIAAGDDAIRFRKHTLDLGVSEAVTVVDMNGDGRPDIISGENWYEQLAPQPGSGPHFIKHKFRDLPYTNYYLEDLSDLAIDVNGDGYPDVVSCSYWSHPLTWWENPGKHRRAWHEHVMETQSPVEFAFLVDILNTGKPLQLLPQFGRRNFPLAW
ncbi:MAG: FG-GAP repeat domain-containing protein, partial [Terriglobia bacterium]